MMRGKRLITFAKPVTLACAILMAVFYLMPVACVAKQTSYSNQSSGYEVYIDDQAELFPENLSNLENAMNQVSEYCNVACLTVASNNVSTSTYAKNFCLDYFGQTSATAFVIDMDNRVIYIYSQGDAYKILTRDQASTITDNVYRYASRGKYLDCSIEVFAEINALLSGRKIARPMRIICAAMFGFMLALIITYVMAKKNSAVELADDSLMNIKTKFDIFDVNTYLLTRHVAKHVESSGGSDGGSSSSGSGGSSGGFSGGGGGHSF